MRILSVVWVLWINVSADFVRTVSFGSNFKRNRCYILLSDVSNSCHFLAHWPKTSKSRYDWRSVSQYFLVSSSLWILWSDIIICPKAAVLSLWGALSDERSGLSPVSHCQQYLVHCKKFNIIYMVHVTCFMYMQYKPDLCQHRLSTADHAKTSGAYATAAV
jgi:hypothetical protein